MLTVYFMNADKLSYTDEEVRSRISAQRLSRIERYIKPSDKRASLAVELLLAEHMTKHFGSALPLAIISQDGEKPYLESGLQQFSFAHSSHYAVCAVGDEQVGIDIESADRSVTGGVLSHIKAEGDIDNPLLCWCGKEAYLKFTGQGIGGKYAMKDISVGDNYVENLVTGELVGLWHRDYNGTVIAVCAKNADEVILIDSSCG